jgi:hypothetical protein
VARLDLERYKTTIKGLTQFGDRQQGTDRNRAAVDWIKTWLRNHGCTSIERDWVVRDDALAVTARDRSGGAGAPGRFVAAFRAGAMGTQARVPLRATEQWVRPAVLNRVTD